MRAQDDRSPLDVVLVGRRLPDNENLGLGYLLAALRRAGFHVELQVLNAWPDLERIARRVADTRPLAVGIALPDGGSAYLPLALGELLRRRGFAGHVTAGGPFATLARHWLFERYAWLDSVVRFAGEVPLTALVERLARGERDLSLVPGLTTRSGDGAPAPVLDRTPLEVFPAHDELPEVLGHPMAHVAATRGCPGRCAYCGPAALQSLEHTEGRRGGCAAAELHDVGVGGVRRRDLGGLCDEMAALWHERGVRYFYFVDEHLLPHAEEEALEFLSRWRFELRRHGVRELGLGCMLRGDLLTPDVIRAFRDVGLVRCFVGIELATAEERRRFARGGSAERAREMMGLLEEAGVATISNLMLVHPYSTVESIAGGIEFLAGMRQGAFETTEMRAYHGTRLAEVLRKEGRLQGNPLRYSYSHLDDRVARFAEILARLRGQGLRDYSPSFRVHDLMLETALARRLHPEIHDTELAEAVQAIGVELNDLRVSALREALRLALDGKGFSGCSGLVRDTRRRVEALERRVDGLTRSLLAALPRPARCFSPMRSAAAYALGFALSTTPACYSSHGESSDDAGEAADARDVPAPDDTEPGDDAAAECDMDAITARIATVDPCRSVFISCFVPPELSFDSWPRYDATYCGSTPPGRLEGTFTRMEAVLTAADRTCLCETRHAYRIGGDQEDYDRMSAAILPCPDGTTWSEGEWYHVVVVVDADGRVTDVRVRDPAYTPRPEAMDCIRSALVGLTFPCLAGYEVCPEYVFVE